MATQRFSPLDGSVIQPYGCIYDRHVRPRPRLCRAGGCHQARYRPAALDGREGIVELAGHYPMSFAAVQKHVAVLERAGLVTKERTGRRKVVRTNIEGSSWLGACSISTRRCGAVASSA